MDTILENLVITKAHSAFSFYTNAGKAERRSNRPSWAISFKAEGETIYINNGKQFLSNSQNIVILSKGSSYRWECTQSGRCYIIEFDCEQEYDGIFSFPIKNTEKILPFFKNLEYKRIANKTTYKLEFIKNVYSLLILLLQSKPSSYFPTAKHEKILPAVKYILENYTKKIKNEDLAAIAGVSTTYFRQLFTQAFGIPPITYIHQLRIKKAKDMLKSDYTSIADIAFSLGYADIYDFSRAFKKYVGVSPLKYLHTTN